MYGEIRSTLTEFKRAVKGVHYPDPIRVETSKIVLALLTQDAIIGSGRAEPIDNEQVRSAVSLFAESVCRVCVGGIHGTKCRPQVQQKLASLDCCRYG
jgi:hypothetical protein